MTQGGAGYDSRRCTSASSAVLHLQHEHAPKLAICISWTRQDYAACVALGERRGSFVIRTCVASIGHKPCDRCGSSA
jgi:hypothetical protein